MEVMSRSFVCTEDTRDGEFMTRKPDGKPGMACLQSDERHAEGRGMFVHRATLRGQVVRADTVRFVLTRNERPPRDALCQGLDAALGEWGNFQLPPARYPQEEGDVVMVETSDGVIRLERVPDR